VPDNDSFPEKYDKLLDDFQQLEAELKKARRTIEIKEIELKAVLAQSHEISNSDVLTFLPNRRKIIGDLQAEVIRAARYGSPLSISLVDIDHFKNVNDNYGHLTGDETLRTIAARLRDQIRHPDTIGRYGGEEFLIVLPNSDSKDATEQAARLCQQIRDLKIDTEKHQFTVTISVGVAQFRNGQENWEQFLSRADDALYQAKENGRDQWAMAA